jgi:penicillin amidase
MVVVRLLRRLLVGLGVLVLLAGSILAGLIWLTLPPGRDRAAIPGLSAPVDIAFDEDGVPRIRAASATDGAAALGYVHARDRLFQMDLMRRAAAGRLSEIAGPATLPMDRMMRVLGLRRRAEADLAGLAPDTRAMLQAYAQGVNAWIAAHGRFSAPEFVPLGTPAPWTPIDSLLWGKTMGVWLSDNWRQELARLSLEGRVPPDRIRELHATAPGGGHPDEAELGSAAWHRLAQRMLERIPDFPAPFTMPDEASNEWAVDARHSVTGAPLLAGDPHLGFSMPGVWYLARIETPAGVLAGATAPGAPFLVIGRNSRIAWTFTTTGADTQDLFIEEPVGDGLYRTPDGPRAFEVHQERIRVRGEPDEMLTVRETRHGPVISDLGMGGDRVIALAAANLAPGDRAADGLLALDRAGDVAAAHAAAAAISAPVQNLLVADRADIALFMTGRVPVRRAGDGSVPVEGSDGAHDWTGWAEGDALPTVVAPASGRLVNANERVAPAEFPVFLGRDWNGNWRAARIREMLDAKPKLAPADFAAMQADTESDYARRLLPTLRAVNPADDLSARAAKLLADWDGAMTMDRPQPLLFNAWMPRLRDLLLARAGLRLSPAVAGLEFVAFALSPEGAHWCGGDCGPALAESLGQAVHALGPRFGDDPAAWRWGPAHPAVFAHPILGRIPLLDVLGTAQIDSPGDDTTVDRGGTGWSGLRSVHGASYRGVYDLADLDASLFVVAPGQSGNPFRAHSRDFLERWRDGRTITLGPNAARTEATVALVPAGGAPQ